MKHVVMFSSGIASWMTAKRVIERHGEAVLLFADVKGDSCIEGHRGCTEHERNPYVGEDEDNYRFAGDAAKQLGVELVTVSDGRNIWDTFEDDRFLGNNRHSDCSDELKIKPCKKWLETNCTVDDTTIYVGLDWSEPNRKPGNEAKWAPWRVEFPMTEKPYLDKHQMLDAARAEGLEPPRAYREGWPHANCQSACVRAGVAQWAKLLQLKPDVYRYAEEREQKMRVFLGKDVAILRDRSQKGIDEYDFGGCGCFTDDSGKPPPEDPKSRPLTLRELRERIEADPQQSLFDVETP